MKLPHSILALGVLAQVLFSQPVPVQPNSSGATGAAVPARAELSGGVASGNLVGLTLCDTSAQLQMTTATTTQIVALAASKSIRVCSYQVQGSTTATATTLKFVYGTGANCVTAPVNLTPVWNMPASSSTLQSTGFGGVGELFKTASANALCATSSAAGTVNIMVTYTVF